MTDYFVYDGDEATNWALADSSTSQDGTIPFGADPETDAGQIVLQLDENGQPTHRYLWGPAVDMLLADEQLSPLPPGEGRGEGGVVRWTLGDHQNSIRDILALDETSGQWQVANHVTYDAFGNQVAQTGATDCLFAWTGRLRDNLTGLQQNGNRWYDPVTARWRSEDPIGFEGGDANLYRYCANDPVNGSDPSGLESIPPDDFVPPPIPSPEGYVSWEAWTRAHEDYFNKYGNRMSEKERLELFSKSSYEGSRYWSKKAREEARKDAEHRRQEAESDRQALFEKYRKLNDYFRDRARLGWRADWKWNNYKPKAGDYISNGSINTDGAGTVHVWWKIHSSTYGPDWYVTQGLIEGLLTRDGDLVPFADDLPIAGSGNMIDQIDKSLDTVSFGKAVIRRSAKEAAKAVGGKAVSPAERIKELRRGRIPPELQPDNIEY